MSSKDNSDTTLFFRILIEVDQNLQKGKILEIKRQSSEKIGLEERLSELFQEDYKHKHSENIKKALRIKREKQTQK
jgi:hypothetical protein